MKTAPAHRRQTALARQRHPLGELGPDVIEAFSDLRASFRAAQESKFRPPLRGVAPGGSGADFHFQSDVHMLRVIERARELDRNSDIVSQGIGRLIDNCLQDGLTPAPNTGSKDLDDEIINRWESWSTDESQCHLGGEHNLQTLARLAFRAIVVDGDCSVLPNLEGSLEPMEAHRLRSPDRTKKNVVHGVRLDTNRKHLDYWFMQEDIGPAFRAGLLVRNFTQVPARDKNGKRTVFFLRHPKRFSQTRGVSALAPLMDTAGMLDDLLFAALVKQQASACFVLMETRDAGEETSGSDDADPIQIGPREEERMSDGVTRTLENLSPGMRVAAEPGVKIEGYSPDIPSPGFFPHAHLTLTFIAINLGIPVHVLLLDPSKTNFSGWRGAIDQARIGFRVLQNLMADRFYGPTYEWKVRNWLIQDADFRKSAGYKLDTNGNLIRPDNSEINILRGRWNLPHFAYIDPKSDVKADAQIVENGLNSRRRLLARRGLRLGEIDEERVLDEANLIRDAIGQADAINEEFPNANLDWREILLRPARRMIQAQGQARVRTASGNGDSNQ